MKNQKLLARYGKDYIISHTGHSLGGSLAAFSAYETGTSATLFDPFGVREILFNSTEGRSFDTKQLPITTYLSRVNIINGSAPHIGLVLEIQSTKAEAITIPDLGVQFMRHCFEHYTQFKELGAITEEMYADLFKKHSMSTIRASFEYPNKLPALMGFVESWPDSPTKVFAHHALTIGMGNQTRSPNVNSFTDEKNRHRLQERYKYVVRPVSESNGMKQLDACFFSSEFIQLLMPQKDHQLHANTYGIDSEILKICQLMQKVGTNEQYVLISDREDIDIFQLKTYVDRKINFYKLQKITSGIQNVSRELHKTEFFSSIKQPQKETDLANNRSLFRVGIFGAAIGATAGAIATYWLNPRR